MNIEQEWKVIEENYCLAVVDSTGRKILWLEKGWKADPRMVCEAVADAHNAELVAVTERLEQELQAVNTLEQQLAAERQRRERIAEDFGELHDQFLSAQAAIGNLNQVREYWIRNQATNVELQHAFKDLDSIDLSALHQHDAEVRKPLVDALKKLADPRGKYDREDFIRIAADALAEEGE